MHVFGHRIYFMPYRIVTCALRLMQLETIFSFYHGIITRFPLVFIGTSISTSSPNATFPCLFLGSAEFQRLRVIEHLEAKRAHIEHLSFVGLRAGDGKADIGYHFKLKDPGLCDDFEEGQVVGFFEDEDDKTSIQLLDNNNGKRAFMAGVITRSAYLEATPNIQDGGLLYIL